MGALSRWLSRSWRHVSLRDAHLYGGWLLLTAGSVWTSGAWGLVVGGACLFVVGVFGISPTRG